MKQPFFSVIVPTLNEEKFIGNLLDSLAAQTERNFEVIVVDGRSKDKTVNVVESYRSRLPSLTVIQSKKRITGVQRNAGASAAKYEWLVIVDADSVFMPYFFDRVTQYIEHHRPTALTTWFRPDSDVRYDALLTLFANITIEASLMFHRPLAPGPLTIVAKSAHEAVGGYDGEYQNTEDVDYGRRLSDKGYSLHVLRETLYVWSLRRFRKEGTLKMLQRFAVTALMVAVTKKPQKYISGYDLGGALYSLKKSSRLSIIKRYETRLKRLMKYIVE